MAGTGTRIGLWRPQVGIAGGRGGVHVHYAFHLDESAYDDAVARLRGFRVRARGARLRRPGPGRIRRRPGRKRRRALDVGRRGAPRAMIPVDPRAERPAAATSRDVSAGSSAARAPSVERRLARCARRSPTARAREGRGEGRPSRAAEAGRDDRDPDLPRETLVDGRAEDDVRVVRRRLAYDLRGLVDLEQRQVLATRDGEEDAARADELGIDERRAQRALRRLAGAALRGLRVADPHQGRAGVRHHGADVREVEVDQAGHRDQVADPLDALAEHVVGDLEGVDHRRRAVEHLQQAVVRDHDHGVARRAQLLDPGLRRDAADACPRT